MSPRFPLRLAARAAIAGALVAILSGPSLSQENLPPRKLQPTADYVKVNPKLLGAGAKAASGLAGNEAKAPAAGAGAATGTGYKQVQIGKPPRDTVVLMDLDLTDPATRKSFFDYRQKLYAYEAWSLDHTRKVYEWQHGKSEQVFWIVVALVALGIILSWLQFRSDLHRRARRHAPGAPSAEAGVTPPTQFKASLQGIEVNSSLVGVVILTLSLAFFYLYIVHVYTITATR